MPHNVYGSFTLSDDAALEAVVTDIPLFAVGVFSIGVFSFLLAVKRVDLLSIYLFTSSFLGFIAAILDLGQVITRGSENVAKRLLLADVRGYLNAREVFLSFSLGLLYMLWWTFVAHRPIGIPADDGPASPHCAKWTRWGYVGLALKYITLAGCVLITILELVWRLDPKHHAYSSVYVAASTLETTLSAVFILKIFLNFSLIPSKFRGTFTLFHAAPVAALLVGGGIAIGNLALFTFSETALGRFFRGIEVYILLSFFLIATFRSKPLRKVTSISKPTPAVFNEKSQFTDFDSLPTLPSSAANPPVATPRAAPRPTQSFKQPTFTIPWAGKRNTSSSRPPSWFSPSRFPQRPAPIPNESVPWSRDEEAAVAPPSSVLLQRADFQEGRVKEEVTKLRTREVDLPSDTRPDSGLSLGLRPPPKSFGAAMGSKHDTDVSLSQYAIETDFRESSLGSVRVLDDARSGTSSPVYGLDGMITPRRKPTLASVNVPSPLSSSSRGNSLRAIDTIIQQQSELDRSISVLRGQHERENSMLLLSNEQWLPPLPSSSKRITLTPSIAASDKQATANSAISENFSLSNFPQPPKSEPIPLESSSGARKKASRSTFGLVPSQTIELDVSEPTTPTSIPSMQLGSKERFLSATGTQYDVTSFIGALNGYEPGSLGRMASLVEAPPFAPSDDGSDDPEDDAATVVRGPPPSSYKPLPKSPSPSSTYSQQGLPSPSGAKGLGSATMSSSFKTGTLISGSGQDSNPVAPTAKA